MGPLLNLLSRNLSGSPVIQAAVFAIFHGAAVVVTAQLGFIAINICTGTRLTDLAMPIQLSRRLGPILSEAYGPPIHHYWLLFALGIAVSARLCTSTAVNVYGCSMKAAFIACTALGWMLPFIALVLAVHFKMKSGLAQAQEFGAAQQAAEMPAGFMTHESFILFVAIGLFGIAYAIITFPIALWKLARHHG